MGFILLILFFRPNILIFHYIQFLFNIFIEEKRANQTSSNTENNRAQKVKIVIFKALHHRLEQGCTTFSFSIIFSEASRLAPVRRAKRDP